MTALVSLAALLAASDPVVCLVQLPGGGTCRIVEERLDEHTSMLRTQRCGPSGQVLWSADALPVRSDAAGAACACAGGNILSACAFGEGYTDILLQLLDPSGNTLGTDTIAMNCYDAPQALVPAGNGFVLAWDSWSEERGVHLGFIDHTGRVVRTSFAASTVNPGPAALLGTGGGVVLVVSPLLAAEDVLYCYSDEGERLWSVTPALSEGAELVEGIAPAGPDSFTVTWSSLPDRDGITRSTVTGYSLRNEAPADPQ